MIIRRLINKRKNLSNKKVPVDYCDRARGLGVKIGEECEIYDDVSWGSEPYLITIGNHVRITRNVRFITHDGGVWVLRKKFNMPGIDIFGKIVVGNNVHIGMGATIMPGVSIGDDCIIACGAVVTKDVPDGQIWGGVPARFIETIDEYYKKNKPRFFETKLLSPEEKRKYIDAAVIANDVRMK